MALALIAWDVADPQHQKQPFAFEHESVLHRPEVQLEVLYTSERNRNRAEVLADAVAEALAAGRTELHHASPLGPVHIALRETLDVHEYEPVDLEESDDGVLLRANFTAPAFDSSRFVAYVLERVLEHATDGRAGFEPHAWVRSGTAAILAGRGAEFTSVEGDGLASSDLRGAFFYRRHRRPTYGALERYQRTSARFGPDVARALAASAALLFEREHGREAWMAFAREVLRDEPAPGIFAALGEHRLPVAARFAEAVGSLGSFETAWAESLERASHVPRAAGWLSHEVEEGQLRSVRWGIRFSTPPAPGSQCALAHRPLGPFDEVIHSQTLLFREELPCEELNVEGQRLVGRYAEHDRVFLAVELATDDLRVRLLEQRLELR